MSNIAERSNNEFFSNFSRGNSFKIKHGKMLSGKITKFIRSVDHTEKIKKERFMKKNYKIILHAIKRALVIRPITLESFL